MRDQAERCARRARILVSVPAVRCGLEHEHEGRHQARRENEHALLVVEWDA